MAITIDVHPEAQAEIVGSLAYYESKDPILAEDLDAKIEAAVQFISMKPDTWPAYLYGTRRYLFDRFPFSMIYRERSGVIQIVALARHRRKPGYWNKRVA